MDEGEAAAIYHVCAKHQLLDAYYGPAEIGVRAQQERAGFAAESRFCEHGPSRHHAPAERAVSRNESEPLVGLLGVLGHDGKRNHRGESEGFAGRRRKGMEGYEFLDKGWYVALPPFSIPL